MKTENKKKGIAAIAVVMVLMVGLSGFVSALGLSLSYWRENPLTAFPGESKIVKASLQNPSDTSVKFAVVSGNEIASTSDLVYDLKAGSLETFADLNIKIPSDAAIGTEYFVTLSLTPLTKDANKDSISIGTSMDVSFPVKVVERPAEQQSAPQPSLLAFVLVVIAVLVALWIILKKLKGKSGKSKKRK